MDFEIKYPLKFPVHGGHVVIKDEKHYEEKKQEVLDKYGASGFVIFGDTVIVQNEEYFCSLMKWSMSGQMDYEQNRGKNFD